jgi:hypothetical protein
MKNATKSASTVAWFVCAIWVLGALCLSAGAAAFPGDSNQSYLQARVIAHLSMSGATRQMFLRHEGKTWYLYVQRHSQPGFMVVDVTNPRQPKPVRRAPLESLTVMGSGLVVREEPLESASRETPTPAVDAENIHRRREFPESVHVLDVSDPVLPRMVGTSSGVTSVLPDEARSLIYVANDKGIWILLNLQDFGRHACESSDAISPSANCN